MNELDLIDRVGAEISPAVARHLRGAFQLWEQAGLDESARLARFRAIMAEVTSERAPGSPVPVLRQTRNADGAGVLVPAFPASMEPVLVANTTRACYWHFPATGLYNAFHADVTPTPDHGQAGYPRLDSIMRLKGEAAHYIAKACNELGRHKEESI